MVLQQQLGVTHDVVNVIEADSASATMEAFHQHRSLDLILLDIQLPDNQDFSLLSSVKNIDPSVPVAMLSANEDAQKIQQALQLGASGFITKSSNSQVMISAIQLILAGGIYVPPAILNSNIGSATSTSIEDNESSIPAPSSTIQLTSRQKEVLLLMDDGLSNKEIAKELSMSPSTVKVHVAAILRACNVNNRTQAVSFARTHRLL